MFNKIIIYLAKNMDMFFILFVIAYLFTSVLDLLCFF